MEYRGILLKPDAALEMLPLVVYVWNLRLRFFKLTEGCYQMTNTPHTMQIGCNDKRAIKYSIQSVYPSTVI